jgi:type III restriction enzyme
MPRSKKPDAAPLFDVKTTTAPCVSAIRTKVATWRGTGYPGASDTTQRLLNYWFHTDHRLANGRKFAYHYSQQHAVETLIYLYEIAKVRRQKSLVESFASRQDLKLLQYDDFARYCVKMATGSGKTKVMALAIAWQYFNAVAEARDDYAKTFLLLAPNVIVFERLRSDFGGGRIFQFDPIIPDDLRIYWDFQCYMRGDSTALRAARKQWGRARRDDGDARPKTARARHGGRGFPSSHRCPRRARSRRQRRGPSHP